jgi:multidrug efflux pump subunit AcrA (membrane-fusion protein)
LRFTSWAKPERPSNLSADQTSTARARREAGLKQTRLQHARQEGLVDDGTTSHRELEAAEADEDRLKALRDQKAAEFDASKHLLQVILTQGLEAQQTVKTKEAELELARIDLGYTRIVSPASGQLSERASLPGEYVTPGSKIGLVVPLPNVWIVANIRESQMAHMYPGQSAVITVDSAPASTSLRLNSQGKFSELLTNTGFYSGGRGTSLASLAARTAHTASDPMSARAQAVQIIASAARRQAAVLGISDTFAALGWLLFVSCLLVVLMAEFGSGHALRPQEIRP